MSEGDTGDRKGRGKSGADLMLDAERIRSQVNADRQSALVPMDRRRADELEAVARGPVPAAYRTETVGGELVPVDDGRGSKDLARSFRNTLADPDYVSTDASRDRLELLNNAGALGLGLDVADSLRADNSVEKMIAHQMGALHRSIMKMNEQLSRQLETLASVYPKGRESETNNIQAARLAGAISRMGATFNDGVRTLRVLRSGGKQTVVVKHVHQQVQVNEGGQALVAGEVNAEGGALRRRGSRSKNGK